jgi:hypothetical protein
MPLDAHIVTPAQQAELRRAGYSVWCEHGRTWSWGCLFGGACHMGADFTAEQYAWLDAARHFLKRREPQGHLLSDERSAWRFPTSPKEPS